MLIRQIGIKSPADPSTKDASSIVVINGTEIMCAVGPANRKDYEVAIDNLVRMGCATLFRDIAIRGMGPADYRHTNYEKICITSLGVSFVDACLP